MSDRPIECSLIIPTRNRRAVLQSTLRRIERLLEPRFEVIVVDNGSDDGTIDLSSEFPFVRWIELGANLAAAGRNVGAMAARGPILLMLDDDSWPEAGMLERLAPLFDARPDLGAIGCRVRLSPKPARHDAGGVPGIFFNCGGGVRREAFIRAGGFPPDYEYYVEEYALACRLWQDGWRIEPRGDLLVWHARVAANRDNNNMLRLLVRNNLRLWARYAPASQRRVLLASTIERYARVAQAENAVEGFDAGLAEARRCISRAPAVRPLTHEQFDGLYGLDVAERTIVEWMRENRIQRVAVWTRGKGCEHVVALLHALGMDIAIYDESIERADWEREPLLPIRSFDPSCVDGIVIGSLSPGVAEDVARSLVRRWPDLPIISPAPWQGDIAAPSLAAIPA